jgi:hypothetical protein
VSCDGRRGRYLRLVSEPTDAAVAGAADGANGAAPVGVPLRLAVLATGVETLALAGSALGLALYRLAGHRPFDMGDLWAVVAMATIGAIGLGLVVRGLARARRWARSPAVLTQLIGLPIGINAIGHGGELVGILLTVFTLIGLFGLFAPSTSHRLSTQ